MSRRRTFFNRVDSIINVRHILDEIPNAIHGYSFYQMRSSQQFCIRANNPGVGVSEDIGFKNGYINTDQLKSLNALSSISGVFLETIYDQSGNGNHLTASGSGGRRMTINPNTGICSLTGLQGFDGYTYNMLALNGILDAYHVSEQTDLETFTGNYPIAQKGFFGYINNTNFMAGYARNPNNLEEIGLVGAIRNNSTTNRRATTAFYKPKSYYQNRKVFFNVEFDNPILKIYDWDSDVVGVTNDLNYPFTELPFTLGYGGTGGTNTTPYNSAGPFHFHAMWKQVLSTAQKSVIKQYLEETYNL